MKDIQIDFQNYYGTGIALAHPVCPLTTVRNTTDGNLVRNGMGKHFASFDDLLRL
jgi:hypothetical protein